MLADLPRSSLLERREGAAGKLLPGLGAGGGVTPVPPRRYSHVALGAAESGLQRDHTFASLLVWPGDFTLFGRKRGEASVCGLQGLGLGGEERESRSQDWGKRRAEGGQAALPAPSAERRPAGTEGDADGPANPTSGFRVPGSGRGSEAFRELRAEGTLRLPAAGTAGLTSLPVRPRGDRAAPSGAAPAPLLATEPAGHGLRFPEGESCAAVLMQ